MKDGTKGFDGRLEQESSGAGELLEVGELLVAGEAGSVSCGVVPARQPYLKQCEDFEIW